MGKTRDEILKKLEYNRDRDKILGYTSAGIHREDIDIYMDGKKAGEYASQGQQRSIVIAMKLAESDIMQQVTDVAPAVLLDDVLSELDPKRQEFVLSRIRGGQVFITCCEDDRLPKLLGGKVLHIKEGTIR